MMSSAAATAVRLLLVEDDADASDAMTRVLRKSGFDVEWCRSAGAALVEPRSPAGGPGTLVGRLVNVAAAEGAPPARGISMPVTHWISCEDYPIAFTEEEMARFHVREKMARIRSAAGAPAAA